jgi:hypothetical protein
LIDSIALLVGLHFSFSARRCGPLLNLAGIGFLLEEAFNFLATGEMP